MILIALELLAISFLFGLIIRSKLINLSFLIPILLLLCLIISLTYLQARPDYIFTGGGIPPTSVNNQDSKNILDVLIRVLLYFVIGGYLASNLPVLRKDSSNKFIAADIWFQNKKFVNRLNLIIFIFLLTFVLYNWNNLIFRDSYLFVRQGSLNGAARYLCPAVGLMSIAIFSFRLSNRFLPFLSYAIALGIEFSSSSRSFGILLCAYGLLSANNAKQLSKKIVTSLLSLITLIFGISLVLTLRTHDTQGLIPNIKFILENSLNSLSFEWFSTFLVIIPVTIIGFYQATPSGYVLTSLNPLPGVLTNWYEISFQLYLNPWTPTGGIAQIHQTGFLSEMLTWIFLGFITQILGITASRKVVGNLTAIMSAVFLLSASLQLLQYSLRSSMRFYYADALFLFLINSFVKRIKIKRSTS